MALTPQQAFVRALALSRKYTDDSVAGGGAIKGKNCIIKSITTITGGHRVTFEWTLDNGTVQTDTMDVMDGTAGDLEDISDVDINNLADGQILQYNATSDKWENVSPGSVDTNLEDLNDVDFDNLTDGQIIIWDATNQKWVNSENSPAITVDSAISSTSENPVQNKVIKSELDNKISKSDTAGLVKNDGTIDTDVKQNQTLSSVITIDGTTYLTVEALLDALGGAVGKMTDAQWTQVQAILN